MEKEFVPYDLAVKLKELGFDEKCLGVYYNKDGDVRIYDGNEVGDAPLWQQAFDWFYKEYKLWYYTFPNIHEVDWNYHIQEYIEGEFWGGITQDRGFKTQVEARLECLKKLIELVKN